MLKHFSDYIFIKGPVPSQVERDLRFLCAMERASNGADYGETFAEVVAAGVESVSKTRCAQTEKNIQVMRKVMCK